MCTSGSITSAHSSSLASHAYSYKTLQLHPGITEFGGVYNIFPELHPGIALLAGCRPCNKPNHSPTSNGCTKRKSSKTYFGQEIR